MSDMPVSAKRYRLFLLAAGASLGIALAGFEAVLFAPAMGDAAAIVNGVKISRASYAHALSVLSEVKREALSDKDRARMLDRLIEHELLFQRAEALGLARHQGNLRQAVIQAMINFILDEAEADPPDEAQLKRFYQTHRAWFKQEARLHVKRIYLPRDAAARARKIRAALDRGAAFEQLISAGDAVVVDLPDRLLAIDTLRQYLGPALAAKAEAMRAGQVIGPISDQSGIHFLHLRAKRPARLPPFREIKDQVERHYLNTRDQRVLDDYIQRLRDEAELEIAP